MSQPSSLQRVLHNSGILKNSQFPFYETGELCLFKEGILVLSAPVQNFRHLFETNFLKSLNFWRDLRMVNSEIFR